MFTGKPDNLEIFRHFRTNYFKSINEFYKSFFKTLDYDLSDFLNKQKEKIKEKKIDFLYTATMISSLD